MSDEHNEGKENYSFVQETVKDERSGSKKFWSGIMKTAGRGLVFGLAACLAFYALKPWADRTFSDPRKEVTIPQDEENTAETETENAAGEAEAGYPALTIDNYQEINHALYQVAITAGRSVVEIKAVQDENWGDTSFDAVNSVSGVIVWKNGTEVLILAPSRIEKSAEKLVARFADNTEHPVTLKKQDKNLGLAIFSVGCGQIADATMKHIETATLGNSNVIGRGEAVIALGKQFGYAGGVGYGVISSAKNRVLAADRTYWILTTDIPAVKGGSGVLFNTRGEVVGLVNQTFTDTDSMRMVTAYAISDIKEEVELLSNGKGVPYLGIIGVEVPESVSRERSIPRGIYVKEVEADSPAMEAGIRSGDIITEVNRTNIASLSGFTKKLMEFTVGDPVKVKGMRQGASGFVEVKFDVIVGAKE